VAAVATSTTTANAAWLALHATFGQTGPSAIFTEFKNTISQKITMANPAFDIIIRKTQSVWQV